MSSGGPAFLDGYLPYLLRRADQTLSEPFYAVLTRYGVARSEWRVLAVLHELGPLGVVDLAAAALSPQPTVTHAVRRLEERGLLSRRPGTTDKRQRIISVTDTGAVESDGGGRGHGLPAVRRRDGRPGGGDSRERDLALQPAGF